MSDQEALSEAARLMAAKRKQVSTRCLFCGELIEGTTRRRYCTPSHRALAGQYRQQKRAMPAEFGGGQVDNTRPTATGEDVSVDGVARGDVSSPRMGAGDD